MNDSARSRLGAHRIVLAVLVVLAVGFSLLVWLHPTFGFAQDGILAGADLRSSLIQLVWWLAAAFAVVSTVVVLLVPARIHAAARYAAAYVGGLGAVIAAVPILDKFY
jgi:hypothetical protein